MAMNLKIEVALVICSPTQSGKFVLTPKEDNRLGLPSAYMTEQESTLEVAARLLKEHTGLEAIIGLAGWIRLIPYPLADSVERKVDGERVITVPYGCVVPGCCEQSFWFSLPEVSHRSPLYMDHFDILMAISRRLAR